MSHREGDLPENVAGAGLDEAYSPPPSDKPTPKVQYDDFIPTWSAGAEVSTEARARTEYHTTGSRLGGWSGELAEVGLPETEEASAPPRQEMAAAKDETSGDAPRDDSWISGHQGVVGTVDSIWSKTFDDGPGSESNAEPGAGKSNTAEEVAWSAMNEEDDMDTHRISKDESAHSGRSAGSAKQAVPYTPEDAFNRLSLQETTPYQSGSPTSTPSSMSHLKLAPVQGAPLVGVDDVLAPLAGRGQSTIDAAGRSFDVTNGQAQNDIGDESSEARSPRATSLAAIYGKGVGVYGDHKGAGDGRDPNAPLPPWYTGASGGYASAAASAGAGPMGSAAGAAPLPGAGPTPSGLPLGAPLASGVGQVPPMGISGRGPVGLGGAGGPGGPGLVGPGAPTATDLAQMYRRLAAQTQTSQAGRSASGQTAGAGFRGMYDTYTQSSGSVPFVANPNPQQFNSQQQIAQMAQLAGGMGSMMGFPFPAPQMPPSNYFGSPLSNAALAQAQAELMARYSQSGLFPFLSPGFGNRFAPSTHDEAEAAAEAQCFEVEFKAGRTELCWGSAMEGYQPGEFVIVEADRGKDLGLLVQQVAAPDPIRPGENLGDRLSKPTAGSSGRALGDLKKIVRRAMPAELSQLGQKAEDEKKALGLCQQKVMQRKLRMEVVEAEYQFDRRKLTFFFRAEHRIDFRELVRDLFKVYKTRIWMKQLGPQPGGAFSTPISPPISPSPPPPAPLSPGAEMAALTSPVTSSLTSPYSVSHPAAAPDSSLHIYQALGVGHSGRRSPQFPHSPSAPSGGFVAAASSQQVLPGRPGSMGPSLDPATVSSSKSSPVTPHAPGSLLPGQFQETGLQRDLLEAPSFVPANSQQAELQHQSSGQSASTDLYRGYPSAYRNVSYSTSIGDPGTTTTQTSQPF